MRETSLFTALGALQNRTRAVPLLTAEQEINLSHRIKRGGPDAEAALHELVEANLRLVMAQAQKFFNGCRQHSMTLSDYIQEGSVGLMTAARKFDPGKGYRFSTYAVFWIRQAMGHAKLAQDRMIRLPSHVVAIVNDARDMIDAHEAEFGRRPTHAELATEMGINLHYAEAALRTVEADEHASLNHILGDEEEGYELGESIPDDDPLPEDAADAAFLRESLHLALGELSPRQQQVLHLRFGLSDNRPHSLQEISEVLGLSRERTRQIEKRALEKLRENETLKDLNAERNALTEADTIGTKGQHEHE